MIMHALLLVRMLEKQLFQNSFLRLWVWKTDDPECGHNGHKQSLATETLLQVSIWILTAAIIQHLWITFLLERVLYTQG